MVAEEGRRRAELADVGLGGRVELSGGDPGLRDVTQQLEGASDHEAGDAHAVYLFGGLELDPPVAPAQDSETSSSAAKMRWVTSSTSPMPSTSTSSPRER